MNLNTLFLIVVWFWVACFIIAIFIITFLLGKRTVKDDATKAWIFISTGKHISNPLKGKLKGKPTRLGSKYSYNNGKDVVFVPAKYQERFCKQKRMLFLNHAGQLIASPFDNDINLSDNEKDELIYELVSSHIGADGMRALKGHKNISVILIAIIAFIVGAILVYGFTQYQKNMAVKQPAQIEQTKPVEINPPIEIVPTKPEVK